MQTLASPANLRPVIRTSQNARASYDAVLLGRVSTGDTAAMQTLFSKHHVAVYRFVLRRLRDKALAEDVTSEVFLDVWRNADRFQGRSTVSTWILAIARHKAFSARPRRNHVRLGRSLFGIGAHLRADRGQLLGRASQGRGILSDAGNAGAEGRQ